jgi:hypothetical protein
MFTLLLLIFSVTRILEIKIAQLMKKMLKQQLLSLKISQIYIKAKFESPIHLLQNPKSCTTNHVLKLFI